MSYLGDLRLVAVQKPALKDPIVVRRFKFIERLEEQVALVVGRLENPTPSPAVQHPNLTTQEESSHAALHRHRSPWWWIDKDGKTYLSIKYGSQVIELQKGKPAILCEGLSGVKRALEALQKAAEKGELDALLQVVGGQLRKRFQS